MTEFRPSEGGPVERAGIAGSFSFQSLACHLFHVLGTNDGNDDVLSAILGNSGSAAEGPWGPDLIVAMAKDGINRRQDVTARTMIQNSDWYKALSTPSRARVFHEQIHFWQLITMPMLQYRLLLQIERLRAEIHDCLGGGMAGPFAFTSGSAPPSSKAVVDDVSRALDATILRPDEARTNDVVVTNKLPAAGLLFATGRRGDGPEVIVNMAALGRGEAPEVFFPLSGHYLLESAAFIAEHLFKGLPPPEPEWTSDPESIVYRGAWIFWCRSVGNHFKDRLNAALAFLAAVDIAMAAPIFALHFSTSFRSMGEMGRNCSHRFALAMAAANHVAPLEADPTDPAAAIARYQEDICADMESPTPGTVARQNCVVLTALLAECYIARRGADSLPEPMRLLLRLPESLENLDASFRGLPEIWTIMEQDPHFATYHMWGERIIGAMLNAAYLRHSYPGQLTVPHAYERWMSGVLPLPAIMFRGQYYAEFMLEFPKINGKHVQMPYRTPSHVAGGLLFEDCLHLMALLPLSRGVDECGFVDEGRTSACCYASGGLGCPRLGLTDKEARIRSENGLHHWCHWVAIRLALGIASPEEYELWPMDQSVDVAITIAQIEDEIAKAYGAGQENESLRKSLVESAKQRIIENARNYRRRGR